MKKFISILSLIVFAGQVNAQLKPIDEKSEIQFKAKTFGISVGGIFKGIEGSITFDPTKPADARFDVSVDATSVNTDNSLRDSHLKEESFFDVKNYPRIHFISTRVAESTKKGVLIMFGKLTIKNKTKDMSFPFTVETATNSYLFKGAFTINREDFGVGESNIISDDVVITLQVFAEKQNP